MKREICIARDCHVNKRCAGRARCNCTLRARQDVTVTFDTEITHVHVATSLWEFARDLAASSPCQQLQ